MTLRLSNSWDNDEWSEEFKSTRAAVTEARHIIQDKQEEKKEKDAVAEVILSKAEETGEQELVSN